ncbi:MAG TPA: phosphatase PAP2 family protein [Candidatus Acidoferrales bacterium]|nr:phosphatase PAP2 family protein [Candidatus Acidoferrales bacterium]
MSMTFFRNSLTTYAMSDAAAGALRGRQRKARAFSKLFAEIRRACGAFEWVSLAYLAWITSIIAVFHKNIAHPGAFFCGHCAIAGAILALAVISKRSPHARALRFARHWYPLPLYIFLFEELNALVHAIFPLWLDRYFIAFDHALTGVNPSVWLAQFASPALNDFMQFSYMTYFLYLVVLPALLYAAKERRAFWEVMVSTAIAHYTVYFISVLAPVESPHFSLASIETVRLSGGVCTDLINWLESYALVHGAAFPSAHVAGSTVAILASWRYRQWLFWICLPFFLCMCVATVYGRYHYVADVLAGLITGAWGFYAGQWLMERRGALPSGARATGTNCENRN